ncbi:hypothetical protein [Nonomuraea endophytica]|uniref:hypothetical protein n=1 Tax=Nonomuraea endophytica TaxID=714136 RepID=UPI0037C78571
MAPTRRPSSRQAAPFTCELASDVRSRRRAFVGDLAPEELAEIGPEAETEPEPPESWTPDEYRALLLARGVQDCQRSMAAGFAGYLRLAEAHGLLEKRPNTEPWAQLIAEEETAS